MARKKYKDVNVLEEAQARFKIIFDNFERIYVSFSAGKDSTVLLHLAIEEAVKRKRKIGVLFLDLEGQYRLTIEHARVCFAKYAQYIELYWVCLPLSLRNATSNFQPQWTCWDPDCKDLWIRPMPKEAISDEKFFPFFQRGMEFEEFVSLFGEWYSQGKLSASCVGIRTDESFNRFRAISSNTKETYQKLAYTTRVADLVYNVYPIYDWTVSDVWLFHYKYPHLPYNQIYDCMYRAGMKLSQMRICQPYGDDQKKGLWLFHILEPDAWGRVLARVNGANSGAIYAKIKGNMTGAYVITKPENHTWKSFCELLLASLPDQAREHYLKKFKVFINWWLARGYPNGIPDEADRLLENRKRAPSYRRLCQVILRNDYWCRGLSFSQPRSKAYEKFLELKQKETRLERIADKSERATR